VNPRRSVAADAAAAPFVSEAGWHPLVDGNPPHWARAWGQDEFGVHVNFQIADVRQRMRWIAPGRFDMGSPQDETGRYDEEGPCHEVTLAEGFWLFDTPCTQALWQAVMGGNPSYFVTPTRPVEQVSWHDAQAFISRINDRVPKLDLCLPSEAQWEYACRAGTTAVTYAGEMLILGARNAPVLDPIAWYSGNSGVDFDLKNGWDSSEWPGKQYEHSRAGTHPVALKRPNAWGLYDMLGNVWEWCDDGGGSCEAAPSDGSTWVGGDDSAANCVVRGGSWYTGARGVRAAYRGAGGPGGRNYGLGFRCARAQVSDPMSGALRRRSRRGERSEQAATGHDQVAEALNDDRLPIGDSVKTVRDIFADALALKQQGLDPRQITDRIVDIGHDNGFMVINEHSSGGGGLPAAVELVFPNDEVIYFDGAHWHHRRQ
jgi:formylglycine-generating enzyme required for sulfatase activity